VKYILASIKGPGGISGSKSVRIVFDVYINISRMDRDSFKKAFREDFEEWSA
jgi:hypothetical protein